MLKHINVNSIKPNPMQPRTVFDEQNLQELANSISSEGLQTPILVEIIGKGDEYMLVAGERRLRAHKLLKLETIAAYVREKPSSNEDLLVEATVENVQRSNMNIVDEANAYDRMRKEFKMTVRAISKRTGIYEARISHCLLVASLEEPIKKLILDGFLPASPEPIKALLSVTAGKLRVDLAKGLASRQPTIKMISSACKAVNEAKRRSSQSIKSSQAPAIVVASRKAQDVEVNLPNWNALKQAGKFPPYETFLQKVEDTCDSCALRPVASDSSCSDCPLVDMVKRMTEESNVKLSK